MTSVGISLPRHTKGPRVYRKRKTDIVSSDDSSSSPLGENTSEATLISPAPEPEKEQDVDTSSADAKAEQTLPELTPPAGDPAGNGATHSTPLA